MKHYKLGTYKIRTRGQSRIRTFFAKLLFWSKVAIGTGMMAGIFFAIGASTFSTQIVIASAPEKVEVNTMPQKIADLKSQVVEAISACEVPGYKEGQAPIILDTNNKMSIGPMMFQVATVQHYEQSLYGKTVTQLEATSIALDPVQAKALAQDIMFKDAKGVANWWNCMNRTNVAPTIAVIKSLEE